MVVSCRSLEGLRPGERPGRRALGPTGGPSGDRRHDGRKGHRERRFRPAAPDRWLALWADRRWPSGPPRSRRVTPNRRTADRVSGRGFRVSAVTGNGRRASGNTEIHRDRATGNGRRVSGNTEIHRDRATAIGDGESRRRRHAEVALPLRLRTPRGRGASRTPSGFLASPASPGDAAPPRILPPVPPSAVGDEGRSAEYRASPTEVPASRSLPAPRGARRVSRGGRRARETSGSSAKSKRHFQWTMARSGPTFRVVTGKGDRPGGDRPERVGPEPARAKGTSDRAHPARGGAGPARGHRKRPSGRDRAEGPPAERLRSNGEERTVARSFAPAEAVLRGGDRRNEDTPRGRKLPRGFSRPGHPVTPLHLQRGGARGDRCDGSQAEMIPARSEFAVYTRVHAMA